MTLLVTLTGPSQAGKSTLMQLFIDRHPEIAKRVPTATSRAPRSDEIPGVDKFFVDTKDFDDESRFLEHVVEHGNHYGILKEIFLQTIKETDVAMMDLDMRGARNVLKYVQRESPEPIAVLAVFVTPQTFEEIEQRIHDRGDSNAEARIQSAHEEWKFKDDPTFDLVIDTSLSVEESYKLLEQEIMKRKDGYSQTH